MCQAKSDINIKCWLAIARQENINNQEKTNGYRLILAMPSSEYTPLKDNNRDNFTRAGHYRNYIHLASLTNQSVRGER